MLVVAKTCICDADLNDPQVEFQALHMYDVIGYGVVVSWPRVSEFLWSGRGGVEAIEEIFSAISS